MGSRVRDADISLEQVWADLEELLGDSMPEQVFPEDQSWFSIRQYRERYKASDKTIRAQLRQWVDDGILEQQLQRRHGHNIMCYRPVKDRPA